MISMASSSAMRIALPESLDSCPLSQSSFLSSSSHTYCNNTLNPAVSGMVLNKSFMFNRIFKFIDLIRKKSKNLGGVSSDKINCSLRYKMVPVLSFKNHTAFTSDLPFPVFSLLLKQFILRWVLYF